MVRFSLLASYRPLLAFPFPLRQVIKAAVKQFSDWPALLECSVRVSSIACDNLERESRYEKQQQRFKVVVCGVSQ